MSLDLTLHHLSASTINSFLTDRFGWFMRKFKGTPFQTNVNMERGKALEKGLDFYIEHEELIDAQNVAVEEFKENAEGLYGYDVTVCQSIKDVLAKIVQTFPVSEVIGKQQKIVLNLPELKYPIIGYTDYELSSIVIDLKSTTKKPSKLSQNYVLQGSVYRKAKRQNVEFWFGIHTKTANLHVLALTDEEYEFGLKYLIKAAKQIERVYELLRTPFDFQGKTDMQELFELLCFPNLSACWNKDDFRLAASTIGL